MFAVGGALGVMLASWMLMVMVPRLPPRVEGIGINPAVLGFATLLLVAMALVVGVWPSSASSATSGTRG
jgi:predicted lysophospholipase L1 biosynthesis ABC-type transport system permease subunit